MFREDTNQGEGHEPRRGVSEGDLILMTRKKYSN